MANDLVIFSDKRLCDYRKETGGASRADAALLALIPDESRFIEITRGSNVYLITCS